MSHLSPFVIEWQCPACKAAYGHDIGECGRNLPEVCCARVRPVLAPSPDAIARGVEVTAYNPDDDPSTWDDDVLVERVLRAALEDCDVDGFPCVAGHCPACGLASLFVGDGGHLTCSSLACPDPCAADRILDDGETEHIVHIEETRFHLQHPLRERGADLFACDMHERLSALDGPPARPGRYRVTHDGERFHWTVLAYIEEVER